VKQQSIKDEATTLLKATDSKIISLGRGSRGKRPYRLLIGPTNSAGQARAWAVAMSRRGLPSQSMRISNDLEAEWFTSDVLLPRLDWTTLPGRISLAERVVSNYDAVLIESMRPLFSLHTARDYSAGQTFEDIRLLNKAKVRTGIVFHGSDIRDTQAHARRERFSPYNEESNELNALQNRAAEFREAGRDACRKRIPVFVTSPDLLLDIPRARWLPIVIDVEHFATAGGKRACWVESGVPKVLFQPSRGWLKSASLIEPILQRLSHEGVIQLIANEPIAHELMAERIVGADVVIDRFDGISGVTSMEALAAGRIVIANIAKWAYQEAEATPPVLHATPDSLEGTLREIARKGPRYPWNFASGLSYVRKWHDGNESATRIAKYLKL
jgi:hypothetical protein